MPARVPAPSVEALRAAALWCENYEGSSEDGDRSDCEPFQRVAAWLEQQADAKELRDAAREGGVPVGKLRARVAAMQK